MHLSGAKDGHPDALSFDRPLGTTGARPRRLYRVLSKEGRTTILAATFGSGRRPSSVEQRSCPRKHFFDQTPRERFREPAASLLVIDRAYLIAQNDSLCARPRAAQRNGEAVLSGEFAALGDGANQYQSESVELGHGEDENRAFPALFVALNRVKVEV